MAFCNSCGATLDAGTKFCNKCGTALPAASIPVSTPGTAAPAQGGGSNVLKIVLIVVAVLVGLGVIGAVTTAYVAHRAYTKFKESRIEEKNGHVKIETPMGTVESSQDSGKVASDLGDFMYPGADAVKDASSSVSFGDTHTVSTELLTSDAPDKVAEYYKSKMPKASYTSSQGSVYSIMAGDEGNKSWTTITIAPEGDQTKIQISRVKRS